VLVVFVTVDGEGLGSNAFRRSQNCINCERRERKIQGVIKNSVNKIFNGNFPPENINLFFFNSI